MISGPTVYAGSTPLRGYVSVLPATVPSSLGADSPDIPGWAAWILDRIEGFVWPDADVDRLRAAAKAWLAAAEQCADLASCCSSAVTSLTVTRSPEIPLAVETTERLAARCHDVATQCETLAHACTTYAHHVETARAEVLDLVHDLLRDAVVIQGVGIVLGFVTAGTTAGAAAAFNTAKIAAAAPRFIRVITTLRSLAAACAGPVRGSVTALTGVRRDLVVFQRARATLVSTYDAERVARVARLQGSFGTREAVRSRRPSGASARRQIGEMLDGWETRPPKTGEGIGVTDARATVSDSSGSWTAIRPDRVPTR